MHVQGNSYTPIQGDSITRAQTSRGNSLVHNIKNRIIGEMFLPLIDHLKHSANYCTLVGVQDSLNLTPHTIFA